MDMRRLEHAMQGSTSPNCFPRYVLRLEQLGQSAHDINKGLTSCHIPPEHLTGSYNKETDQ